MHRQVGETLDEHNKEVQQYICGSQAHKPHKAEAIWLFTKHIPRELGEGRECVWFFVCNVR